MLAVRLIHEVAAFSLDAAFEAPAGVTALFGPSGAGKSMVVGAVAGLVRPRAGRIALGERVLLDTDRGRFVPAHRRRVGVIFQEGRLFPHMTVRGNLAYGRRFAPRGAPRPETGRIIDMLGIGHLMDRRPGGLSGGEAQRVAVGRALNAAPELILADEPLAALDAARRADILPYFERLRDALSVPVLYVSHSAGEVARLADKVVVIRAGRVVRQGPAADVLGDPEMTPLGPREAGAVITARMARQHADGLSELEAGGAALFLPRIERPAGAPVRLRIAAHEVILSRAPPQGLSALNILPGTVASLRAGAGPGMLVAVDTPAGRVLARITQRSAAALELAPGAACHAVIKTVSVAPEEVGGG